MIIAIDPGDVRIGFAAFTYDAEKRQADLRIKEIVDLEGLYERFELCECLLKDGAQHIFVAENFRVDGHDVTGRGVTFQWNEMLTSQVIGAVKYAAYRMNRSPVIIQEPRILAQARKWCDFPMPRHPNGHIKDDVSAYCHGAHYMMRTGMVDNVRQILKFGQEAIPV